MRTPPLLISLTFALWSLQTGKWALGIGAALLLEISFWLKFRLKIEARDFQRIWIFCLLLTLGIFMFFYNASIGTAPTQVFFVSQKGSMALAGLLTWLPLIFFPLAFAQAYNAEVSVPLSTFLFKLDKKVKKLSSKPPRTINLLFPYLMLCLLSASAINQQNIWFYPAVCLALSWGLWRIRPKRYSPVIWGGLLIAVCGVGYAGSIGWYNLAKTIDDKVADLMLSFFQSESDPMKTRTAIGEIGSLKMSGKILMRIQFEKGHTQKLLLPQNGYNTYNSSVWFASKGEFKPVSPLPRGDDLIWPLQELGKPDIVLSVTRDLEDGKGFIAVPSDTLEVENLAVEKMSINHLGSIRVEGGQEFASYKIRLGAFDSIWSPPGEKDLAIPEQLEPVLEKIIKRLKLKSLQPEEIPKTIGDYFEKNFSYTLNLKRINKTLPPLEDFLLNTRAGHCEYFATATALLLRKAGLPARYIFGYSAHEYDWQKKGLVVRSRNTHSWAIAYVNGKWVNVDTTPSTWIDKDKEEASSLEGIGDLWSWLILKFSKWRYGKESETNQTWALIILVPILIFLLYRIIKRTRFVGKTRAEDGNGRSGIALQANSDFQRVESFLQHKGFKRRPWETYRLWVRRMEQESEPGLAESLEEILEMHYRERFDPNGIVEKEKERLENQVEAWIQRQPVN